MVAELARTLHITPDQALARLGREAAFARAEARARTGGSVTAGHCGTTGATTSQPSGSFAGSSFPGNDYAWVRVAAGNTPRALVNRYPGTVSVAGSQASGVGASVCRSGSTTGWHCGRW